MFSSFLIDQSQKLLIKGFFDVKMIHQGIFGIKINEVRYHTTEQKLVGVLVTVKALISKATP